MHAPRHARAGLIARVLRAARKMLGMQVDERGEDAVARAGEDEGVRHLKALGCTILARNALVPFGEADILAQDASGLVLVVEVKARLRVAEASAKSQTIAPGASITHAKRTKLARIARYLQARNRWPQGVRVDAIEVELERDGEGKLRVRTSKHHAGIARVDARH